tara:strand:+ start:695 stop:1135 length:441 start_codon:yes stop_codon:yes gene_type:complete
MKIWKAKNNYGLEVKELLFTEITFTLYYRFVCNLDDKKIVADGETLSRYPRWDKMMEHDELMHPVLLTKKYENINGGLRINVAIEKGYDGIDCIICETKEKFDKLQLIQWGDASNHFITEKCMEPQEYKEDTREFHLKDAWDRYSK